MRTHNCAGFSFIELVVVLAIVAIIISLTFTNIGFLNQSLMQIELSKLYGTCMYAQRVAMTTNKKQTITFDTINKTYSCNGRKETLPESINFGFIAGIKGPPSAPHKGIVSPITFTQQKIVFEPNGIIQPGTVYLVDAKKQKMYALSSPISQFSFLRRYRYDKKWIVLG